MIIYFFHNPGSVPDFRSGMETVIETGPGAWELRAKGQTRDKKHKVTSNLKAIPTSTHMALVKLQKVRECVCEREGESWWLDRRDC